MALKILGFFIKVVKNIQTDQIKIENKLISCSVKLIFNNNLISGWSLVIGGFLDDEPVDLTIIENVDYSKTLVSSIGLSKINKLGNLKSLKIDYCPKITELLNTNAPLLALETISMVGSGILIGAREMTRLGMNFPNLKRLDYTPLVGNNSKVLGIKDVATYQSIIGPILYSCGHIMGKVKNNVPNACYSHCKSNQIGLFKPAMTSLKKVEDRWTVRLIDYNRNILSDRKYYHIPCGNLFNVETLQEILFLEELDESTLLNNAHGNLCKGCHDKNNEERVFDIMKVHFEEIDVTDLGEASQSMKSLNDFDEYTYQSLFDFQLED